MYGSHIREGEKNPPWPYLKILSLKLYDKLWKVDTLQQGDMEEIVW